MGQVQSQGRGGGKATLRGLPKIVLNKNKKVNEACPSWEMAC